jgi:hypothetical protein
MNSFGYLTFISLILFFVFVLVGYPVCYFVITPILMNKHGKRSYRESYLWITNCLYAEDDLGKLYRETGDATVMGEMESGHANYLGLLKKDRKNTLF